MRFWPSAIAATAVGAVALTAIAADHRDSPATIADPSADINDVYTFLDGDRVVLAMTVFPIADASSRFSENVQYVFNLDAGPTFGDTPNSMKIICTFDAAQTASCWAGDSEYVTGNAGGATGITSASGNFQVFAGLRADPFFFNLEGFNDAVAAVVAAAPTLLPLADAAGCPPVDPATSAVLVDMLQSTNMGADPAEDFFADLDTLAIVVSINKSALPQGPIMSVWASTHTAP